MTAALSASPSMSIAAKARSRHSGSGKRRMIRSACRRCACTVAVRIASTVSEGKIEAIWNERAMPRLAICAGGSPTMSSPASVTRPLSGRIAPEMRLKKVVLPAPFGPMIAVSEPGANLSETSWIAATPPKDFDNPSTASMRRHRRAGRSPP